MRGERIEAAKNGCQKLAQSLCMDSIVGDIAYISLFDFHNIVRRRTELVYAGDFVMPDIEAEDGASFLGLAMSELLKYIESDVHDRHDAAFYSPLVFVIMDGCISDLSAFRAVREDIIRGKSALRSERIVICVTGQPGNDVTKNLKSMTENILILDTVDNQKFTDFFVLNSLRTAQTLGHV